MPRDSHAVNDDGRPAKRPHKELEQIRLDIPTDTGADIEFFKQLFGKASTFPPTLLDNTGCQCSLTEKDHGGSILITLDRGDHMSDAITRIQTLFQATRETQENLLAQFTNARALRAWRNAAREKPAEKERSTGMVQKECVELPIPLKMAPHLMTSTHKQLIIEESGCRIDFDQEKCCVKLLGVDDARIQLAKKLLQRVISHCSWGSSEDKVRRILKPKQVESITVRLSPMTRLPNFEKRLTTTNKLLSIGKDKTNDVSIQDSLVSRQHCLLEFDGIKGCVYIVDTSTNGTYLNSQPLPANKTGKVILSHGDDLILKSKANDPAGEFGWVVSITEMGVKEEVQPIAAKRLKSGHQMMVRKEFPSL